MDFQRAEKNPRKTQGRSKKKTGWQTAIGRSRAIARSAPESPGETYELLTATYRDTASINDRLLIDRLHGLHRGTYIVECVRLSLTSSRERGAT